MKLAKLMPIFLIMGNFSIYSMNQELLEIKVEEETQPSPRLWRASEKLYEDKNKYTINPNDLKKLPDVLSNQIYSYKLKELQPAFEYTHPFKMVDDPFVTHTNLKSISSDCRYAIEIAEFKDYVYIRNLQTGETLRVINTKKPLSVALSPDGTLLITSSRTNGEPIKIYKMKNGEILHTFNWHNNVTSTAISSNNKYAIIGSADGQAITLNLETGQRLHPHRPIHQEVSSVAITPDGTKAILGSKINGTAKVLDIETDQYLHTINHNEMEPEPILTNNIEDISFVVDASNEYFVTGFSSNTAKVWNIKTGELVNTFRHNGYIRSLAISSNNKYIIANFINKKFTFRSFLNRFFNFSTNVWNIQTNELIYTSSELGMGPGKIGWDNKYIINSGVYTFRSGNMQPLKGYILPEEQINIIKSLSAKQLSLVTDLCRLKEIQKNCSVILKPEQRIIFESLPDFIQKALKENCNIAETSKQQLAFKALKAINKNLGNIGALAALSLAYYAWQAL